MCTQNVSFQNTEGTFEILDMSRDVSLILKSNQMLSLQIATLKTIEHETVYTNETIYLVKEELRACELDNSDKLKERILLDELEKLANQSIITVVSTLLGIMVVLFVILSVVWFKRKNKEKEQEVIAIDVNPDYNYDYGNGEIKDANDYYFNEDYDFVEEKANI